MNPTVQAVLSTISQCEQVLASTSGNDPTFRAMLAELLHQEQAQAFVRQQLAGSHEQVVGLGLHVERLESEAQAKDERLAALEAELAQVKAMAAAPVATAVDEITGHQRPHLMPVNEAETA